MMSGLYLLCYWNNPIQTYIPQVLKNKPIFFSPRAQGKIEGICEFLEHTVSVVRMKAEKFGVLFRDPFVKK